MDEVALCERLTSVSQSFTELQRAVRNVLSGSRAEISRWRTLDDGPAVTQCCGGKLSRMSVTVLAVSERTHARRASAGCFSRAGVAGFPSRHMPGMSQNQLE